MSGPEVLQRLRAAHTESLLAELLRAGGLTRSELVRRTGLSRSTISAILGELLRSGAVVEQPDRGEPGRGRGRPTRLVTLNPSAGHLVGVDIAQTSIHIALVNLAHEVVVVRGERIAERAHWRQRVRKSIGMIESASKEYGVQLDTLQGVGLGLFGVIEDPQLPGALSPSAEHIADELSDHFGVPVAADNTSRLAALAESTWGAGAGAGDVVYLRWSEGVGGGVVVGGQLVRGAHGLAGQLGHVSIDPDGPPCSCGGRGCLNPRIRLRALVQAARRRGSRVRDFDDLVERAREGDRDVLAVLRDAADDLGFALASIAVHVDPARIVIGGEVAELGDLVLDRVREVVRGLAFPSAHRPMQIVPAALGIRAAALGAVALVLAEAGRADATTALNIDASLDKK